MSGVICLFKKGADAISRCLSLSTIRRIGVRFWDLCTIQLENKNPRAAPNLNFPDARGNVTNDPLERPKILEVDGFPF